MRQVAYVGPNGSPFFDASIERSHNRASTDSAWPPDNGLRKPGRLGELHITNGVSHCPSKGEAQLLSTALKIIIRTQDIRER